MSALRDFCPKIDFKPWLHSDAVIRKSSTVLRRKKRNNKKIVSKHYYQS